MLPSSFLLTRVSTLTQLFCVYRDEPTVKRENLLSNKQACHTFKIFSPHCLHEVSNTRTFFLVVILFFGKCFI